MGNWTSRGAIGAGILLLNAGSVYGQDTVGDLPSASLEVEQYYTDNVFFSRPLYDQRRLDDWVTVVRPRVEYNHAFQNGYLNLGTSAAIGRYATYSSENYIDLNLWADGQYRFDPMTAAVWNLGLSREHKSRNSIEPSDQIGAEPTVYWHSTAQAAIARRLGDNRIQFGATYDGYDYLDVDALLRPFVVNQDDRDRDMFTLGGRHTWGLGEGRSVYFENIADLRQYRTAFDDNGFDRDSSGLRSILGLQTRLGENGRGEIFGGVLYHDFSDPRFDTVVTPDFGARYSWQSEGALVEADLRRSIEETTIAGASSYLRTAAQVRLRQDLGDGVRVYGGLGFADLDFQNSSRRDEVSNFWIGIRKYLTPHFYIDGEAAFQDLDSTDPVNDYTEARFMARLGIDSQRAFEPDDARGGIAFSGFYVGAGGEISHLGTMLDGPRQNTKGSLTSDFGGFGPGGFLLAGWGADIGSTYVGLEAISASRGRTGTTRGCREGGYSRSLRTIASESRCWLGDGSATVPYSTGEPASARPSSRPTTQPQGQV